MHGEKTLMAIQLAARRARWLTDENSGLTSFENRGNVFPRTARAPDKNPHFNFTGGCFRFPSTRSRHRSRPHARIDAHARVYLRVTSAHVLK